MHDTFALTENVAILGYLADLHPHAQLAGDGTPRGRAEVMRWLAFQLFALRLPVGTVGEFVRLGAQAAWLAIPFSVLIGWMYLALDQVGDSTENPFEGSANDIPITCLARSIEHELSALHGLAHDVPPPPPGGHILL